MHSFLPLHFFRVCPKYRYLLNNLNTNNYEKTIPASYSFICLH